MRLKVERFNFSDLSTEGQMSIDGEAFAWTLELPVIDGKPGSAIPTGTYKVVAYLSPHFGRLMPLLVGVPGRSEIEIHPGNRPDQTRGCILLGDTLPSANVLGQSRQAFDNFWARSQGAIEMGECDIEIMERRDPSHSELSELEQK